MKFNKPRYICTYSYQREKVSALPCSMNILLTIDKIWKEPKCPWTYI